MLSRACLVSSSNSAHGGGESTRCLLSAASVCGAKVLSVDIDDCDDAELRATGRWHFIRDDDVGFAEHGFVPWCQSMGVASAVDVLLVDTSHLYEHTKREIGAWLPHLSQGGIMMFHDTNMGKGVYCRLDGSLGWGWDNSRGVIRAIEELVGARYDESAFWSDVRGGFLIRHYPNSNGLTVLRRLAAGVSLPCDECRCHQQRPAGASLHG